MTTRSRTIYRESVEYIDVAVTADVELAAQPVYISFDRETWHTAAWIGSAGETRTARLLLDEENMPARDNSAVLVRVTDNPEAPVIHAGTLHIA